jgi:hypothetical protein
MIDTPVQPDTAQSGTTGTADTPDEPAYPHRKVWWIVGGALTGATLLTFLAVFGTWSWAVSSEDENDTRAEEFDHAVSAADLTVDVGDVSFEAADAAALEFRLHTEWLGAEPETTEDWHGDVFTANGECDGGPLFGLDFDQCQTDYTLGLPAGADASAQLGVGDISLDGLDADIDVTTGVGDIVGENLTATSTTVESGIGEVHLEFDQVLGDINVDAGTGDVVIIVPDDGTTYDVRFDGGVGDEHIEIATDPGSRADYVIDVTGGIGSLTVQYGS